jgi:hypothetical protein
MAPETEPVKRGWIREIVTGKTFADIGGLGGSSINEMVSTAVQAGASEATMVDVLPFDQPLWKDFDARCDRLGISGHKKLSADLEGPPMGPWEVVHSSGILYHAANPVHQMVRLSQSCSQWLIFTSMIVPRRIDGFDLGDGGTIFVPALNGQMRQAFARHFDSLGLKIEGINMECLAPWLVAPGVYNYGPWWWLFTADFIDSLLGIVGFQVVRRKETWPDRAVSWLCRSQGASA